MSENQKCFNRKCNYFNPVNKLECNCNYYLVETMHRCDNIVSKKSKQCKKSKSCKNNNQNSYTFRGDINIRHLINDCIKDGKNAFMAIGKDEIIFGFTREFKSTKDFWDNKSGLIVNEVINQNIRSSCFMIYSAPKKYTESLMKLIKTIPGQVKSQTKKIAKEIHKDKAEGKFSNKCETKVMVF